MPTPQEVEQQLQANRALVEHLYDAFGQNDIPRLVEVLAPDVDWLFFGPDTIPFAGHYHGRDEVAAFFARARETSEFLVFEPREITPGSNHVLVQGREVGRARNTGLTWETEWAHVFTVQNGKIVKLREYYDTFVISAAFHPIAEHGARYA